MTEMNRAPKAGRNFLNSAWEENREPIAAMIEAALREAFLKCGGRPETLHVNFAEPAATDKNNPGFYLQEMHLQFDASPEGYEVPHDEVVRDFYNKIRAAWLRESTNYHFGSTSMPKTEPKPLEIQRPGFLDELNRKASGDFTLMLRHEDIAMIAGVVNRLMVKEHLESVDTRLMQLDLPGYEAGSRGR